MSDFDYYEELGVERDATADEIKAAFRRKSKDCHPDANPGDPEAEARFKRLSEAYDTLSDAERRLYYDEYGRQEVNSAEAQAQDMIIGAANKALNEADADGRLFTDIFKEIRSVITTHIAAITDQMDQHKKQIKQYERLKTRIDSVVVNMVLDIRIADEEKAVGELERAQMIAEMAHVMVKNDTHRPDKRPAQEKFDIDLISDFAGGWTR